MELKKQCLKDFWAWYLLPKQQETYKTSSIIHFGSNAAAQVRFMAMSFTERYGVFVDFFDEVGLELCVDRNCNDELNFTCYIDWVVINIRTNDNYGGGGFRNSRNRARIEAIKKANKIYNTL